MKTINLSSLIGKEGRTRFSARILREQLCGDKEFIIDLSGMTFISRSFADELYNIKNESGNVHIFNAEGIVKKMLDVVTASRASQRKRETDNTVVRNFVNVDELSAYLETF